MLFEEEENKGLYEEAWADILVNGGKIMPDNRIDERSQAQRVYPTVNCPVCGVRITATVINENYHYRCPLCNSNATFFIHVFENKGVFAFEGIPQETHAVYVQVDKKIQQIFIINMNCLSCLKPMAKKEQRSYSPFSRTDHYEEIYCPSNCGVRTFLQLKADDRGIYIQPYLESVTAHPGPGLKNFEIPRHTQPFPVQASSRVPNDTQPAPPSPDRSSKKAANPTGKHVDLKGQTLKLLKENRRPMTRKEMNASIDGTPNNKDDARNKLLEDGYINKVGHGKFVYVRG